METTKIELRREREFGEVFNVTFAFIKQELKPLMRALLVFVAPFVLLLGITFVTFYSSFIKITLEMTSPYPTNVYGMMGSLLVFLLLVLVSQTMINATIFSYLNEYLKNPDGVNNKRLFKEISSNFLPILGAEVLGVIVIAVGFVLCILPSIYLGVSLSLFLIALVIEKKGIGDAFSRSFQLTHMQWGWTFLMIFTVGIINYVLYIIMQIPAYIMGFTSLMHNIKNPTETPQVFSTAYIVYTSVVLVLSHFLYVIPNLLISFQYFNLVEIREKKSLINKIEEIGQHE
jgi:hypothetical protein